MHQPAARSIETEIMVNIDGDLTQIYIDLDRMAQVLGNLVTNAIKYSSENGEVILLAREGTGKVVIGVQDNGPGVNTDELPNIFDRFYRTDKSRQRESGGSGLGLAIAKSLVEAQSGQIWAESVIGEGTTIWMSFPKSIGT